MRGAPANAALPAAYRPLADVKNLAADRALLAALPQLSTAERRGALDLLLHRRRTSALVELLAQFDELGKADQQILADHSAVLHAATRAAVSSRTKKARLGAIQLIARSADPALIYLLPAALRNPCTTTRRCAANALADVVHGFVKRAATEPRNRAHTAQSKLRQRMADAVVQALRSWDVHRRPETIDAAMLLWQDAESTIIELAANARSRFCIALEERLYRIRDPDSAGFFLCALRSDRLADTAARAISRCDDQACLGALFDAAWLLGDPTIHRECSRVRDAAWLRQGVAGLQSLPAERLAGALNLLMAMGAEQSKKIALLMELAESTDDQAGEAAFWRLLEIRYEQVDSFLSRWSARADGRLSALAARELQRRNRRPKVDDSRATTTGPRPPRGPSLQQAAHDHGPGGNGSANPDGIAPSPGRGDSYGPFHGSQAHLGWKLGASEPADRMQALTLIRQERLHDKFADRMCRLVHDGNAQVRSLAVAMIGESKIAAGRQIACRALSDPDSRVQANAIEALDQLSMLGTRLDGSAILRDRLRSESPRVRANAVVILLRHEDNAAAETLIDMLESDVAAHRIAGLWVVEHMRLQSMFGRVERLSAEDPDARVRRRAAGVLRLQVTDRAGMATRGDAADRTPCPDTMKR